MHVFRTIWRFSSVLAIALIGQANGWAALDDTEGIPAALQPAQDFGVNEQNFEQWVFQGKRDRIEAGLNLQLDELNRICQLTDEQTQRLSLAARWDKKRFFDEVDVVRSKVLGKKNDQNAMNEMWREIQPLRTKVALGLFGNQSFFAKSLRKTLDPEQLEKYDALLRERNLFRYRASIEIALIMLDSSVALRQEQHEALVKLLLEETQPPAAFGQQVYHFILYQMVGLSQQKLQDVLGESQWKLLQVQLRQAQAMEPFLIQQGFIAKPIGVINGIAR